jgi:hypothetical protein
MPTIIDRLEERTREAVVAAMPTDTSGTLASMDFAGLLIAYGNWRSRQVPLRPRSVHRSPELQSSAKATEHKAAFDTIITEIESGADLTPHLSSAIEYAHDAEAKRRGRQRRRDRDRLLASWGVHHLHLSTTVRPDGFVERTRDLLFVIFAPDDAYLIGIYPHGSWAIKDMAATIVRNWPGVSSLHRLPSMQITGPEPTDDERLELHEAGVTVGIEVDGTAYMPLGQTTAGTAVGVTQSVNALMHTLRDRRENEAGRLNEASRLAAEKLHRSPKGEWEAAVYNDCCGIMRDTIFAPIAPLP